MKATFILIFLLFQAPTFSQLSIDTTNKGATKSVTRSTQETQKLKLKEVNVLFIGNEMAAANSMHQVFQYIGVQLPIPYKILSANIFGKGFSFKEHNQRTDLKPIFEKYKWNYAIIQGDYSKALKSTDSYKANAKDFIRKLQELGTKVTGVP